MKRKVNLFCSIVNWTLEAIALCFALLTGLVVIFGLNPVIMFIGIIVMGVSGLTRTIWIPVVTKVLQFFSFLEKLCENYLHYQTRRL